MSYAIDIALVIALVAVVLYVRRECRRIHPRLQSLSQLYWSIRSDFADEQLKGKRPATEADIVKGADVWIHHTGQDRVYRSVIYHTWREKPERGVGYFGTGSEAMPSGNFLYNQSPFRYYVDDKPTT